MIVKGYPPDDLLALLKSHGPVYYATALAGGTVVKSFSLGGAAAEWDGDHWRVAGCRYPAGAEDRVALVLTVSASDRG